MSNNQVQTKETMSFKDIVDLLKKSFVRIVIYVLVLSILSGGITLLVMLAPSKEAIYHTRIEYMHNDADKGLNPLGGKLDPNEVRSESIIRKALVKNGYTDAQITELQPKIRENLSVNGLLPEEASQQYFAISSLPNNQAAMNHFFAEKYQSTRYIISLKTTKGTGLSKRQSIAILNSIVETYMEDFKSKYFSTNALDFIKDNLEGIEDFDYIRTFDIFDLQVSNMYSFLQKKAKEAPDFKTTSNMTFADMATRVSAIKHNVKQIELLVTKNALSKTGTQIDAEDYIEDKIMLLEAAITATEKSIDIKTEFVEKLKTKYLIPTADGKVIEFPDPAKDDGMILLEEFHKVLFNDLLEENDNLAKATQEKERWERIKDFYEKVADGTISISDQKRQDATQAVEDLIKSTNTRVNNDIDIIQSAVDEYVEYGLNANQVSQIFPAVKMNTESLSLKLLAVIVALSAFIGFIAAIGITYSKTALSKTNNND